MLCLNHMCLPLTFCTNFFNICGLVAYLDIIAGMKIVFLPNIDATTYLSTDKYKYICHVLVLLDAFAQSCQRSWIDLLHFQTGIEIFIDQNNYCVHYTSRIFCRVVTKFRPIMQSLTLTEMHFCFREKRNRAHLKFSSFGLVQFTLIHIIYGNPEVHQLQFSRQALIFVWF